MYKFLFVSLIFVFSLNIQAQTCTQKYYQNMHRFNGDANDWGGIIGTSIGSLYISAFSSTFPVTLAIAAVVGGTTYLSIQGVHAIQNIKPKKMIRLINESREFLLKGGKPGRLLERLHQKISPRSGKSQFELARYIIEGNNNGSLCLNHLPSYQELKRSLN